MAIFSTDLGRALHLTAAISKERSRQWKTRTRPLLDWQSSSFDSLLAQGGSEAIDAAWQSLYLADSTREQADLLHRELQAIIEFQGPLVGLPYSPDEDSDEDPFPDHPKKRKERPLKKAIELIRTFLESVKEILGELLGQKWKAALQLAIEAADVFT